MDVLLGAFAGNLFLRDVRRDAKQRCIPLQHGHDCALILYEQAH